MFNIFCVNCGKRLDNTLICTACGTDYNLKPKCEHLFDSYMLNEDVIHDYYDLHLKCKKCNEVITLNITKGLCRCIFERF